MKNALHPLPKDERDFKVGAYFDLPKLEDLPTDFQLGTPIIKTQTDDFCSGFATCGAREFQEKTELNPWWSFAKSKEMTGDLEDFGQDLRTACKVHVKFGAVEMSVNQGHSRDIKDYPPLENEAKKHLAQTYLSVTGIGQPFDVIRQTLWKFKDEKRAVAFGLQFSWLLQTQILDNPQETGFGHAMYLIGFKTINDTPYLIAVNSYGDTAGDRGLHYIPRETINKFIPIYGAFMFVDMPREDLQYYLDNGIKESDNWITQLWKVIVALVKSPFISLEDKVNTVKVINEEVKQLDPPKPVEPPKPIIHSDAFGGGTYEERNEMFQLAKRICKEENLYPSMTLDLLATIYGESAYNRWCVNHNTKDYGIAQFSAKYYLKEYNMTPDEAINNPEKCLRIMARNFKAGRQSNWVAYKLRGQYINKVKGENLL